MGAKRGYGEGSVYPRASDGLWIGTIEAGWTASGKRRRITISGKTEGEAKRKLTRRLAELRDEGTGGFANPRTTVKRWAADWLELRERTVRPNTFTADRSAVSQWIVPTIGHRRLVDLTPADVRLLTDAQRRSGLGDSTRRRTHSTLMQMLKSARAEGHNVPLRVLEVDAPPPGVSDRTDLSVPKAVAILGHAAELPHGSRWVAALLQGMRQAECLGLTWEQVDLERRVLILSWQLQPLPYRVKGDRSSGSRVPDGYESRQVKGRLHLVRPKSKAGFRVIPLVPLMASALETWREVAPANPHGLVWTNADGSPIDQKADDAEWYALQAKAGVHHPTRLDDDGKPAPYTVHEARHTTATLLLEAGIDPAIIIAILGHSTIVTSRGYMHASTSATADALQAVAARLELA